MTNPEQIADHYTRGDLLEAITDGVAKLGKSVDSVTVEDLAPVDEFHIGGAAATRAFLEQVRVDASDHVLDIGCGVGGTSRFMAHAFGCRVTGVDLTAEYVEAGQALCRWVGLQDRVRLLQGDALATNFPAATFDVAVMLHVGMNIADKGALAREAWRVLKPGGTLGIYDVMRVGDGELIFPVPWASKAASSAVASPEEYRHALEEAGFVLSSVRDRTTFALDFFERLRRETGGTEGPPPLGLHLLMGRDAPIKVRNMIENVAEGRVAPVELVAHKPEPR